MNLDLSSTELPSHSPGLQKFLEERRLNEEAKKKPFPLIQLLRLWRGKIGASNMYPTMHLYEFQLLKQWLEPIDIPTYPDNISVPNLQLQLITYDIALKLGCKTLPVYLALLEIDYGPEITKSILLKLTHTSRLPS